LISEENPGISVNTIPNESCLFVNGRCLMSKKLARELGKPKDDCLFVAGSDLVAARLGGANVQKVKVGQDGSLEFSDVRANTIPVDASLVAYPWDLIYANIEQLLLDFLLATGDGKRVQRSGRIHKSAVLVDRKRISIGKKSEIGPGVVLDASAGPIFIGSGVKLYPQSVIEGPCFIGDGSMIKIGAKIYGNTSIGPLCKVGGEVDHSIIHGFSNKQHDGFLGHSYLAPWVNLGAGTTTSNLKNTYGNIKVHVDGQLVDSGKMFVGLTAGDHVKTGINATLDTGTVIGPSTNVYGSALPPKYVPPFSWGEAGRLETYDVDKALVVAVRVMARRKVNATEAYKQVFRNVFAMTADERAKHRTN
jgi:UDP-N-acetylglucosamine diphosphorylase/glucosamine-1-phosphate N-acetyltransferase